MLTTCVRVCIFCGVCTCTCVHVCTCASTHVAAGNVCGKTRAVHRDCPRNAGRLPSFPVERVYCCTPPPSALSAPAPAPPARALGSAAPRRRCFPSLPPIRAVRYSSISHRRRLGILDGWRPSLLLLVLYLGGRCSRCPLTLRRFRAALFCCRRRLCSLRCLAQQPPALCPPWNRHSPNQPPTHRPTLHLSPSTHFLSRWFRPGQRQAYDQRYSPPPACACPLLTLEPNPYQTKPLSALSSSLFFAFRCI